MYALGAQGRAVHKQLQQRLDSDSSTVTHTATETDTQRDVQVLLRVLTTTAPSATTTPSYLLSYTVHCLPRVRNEHNVRALFDALLLNDPLFHSFDAACLVVEAVKALVEHKMRVSMPSLPLTKFFHAALSAVYASQAAAWRKCCVLTGFTLARPCYESLAVPETSAFFEQSYRGIITANSDILVQGFSNNRNDDYTVKSVLSVCLACSLGSFTPSMKNNLPHDAILLHAVDLVFLSPLGISHGPLQHSQTPVVKHLGRLSLVVENCLVQCASPTAINSSLSTIMQFSQKLSSRAIDSPECWDFLKTIMFSIVIMLKGYASFSLNIYNGLKHDEYARLTTKVIKTLYLLHFIMDKMGSGGFQAYNFVTYTTTDGLFQHCIGPSQELGQWMVSQVDLSIVPQSQYESSKAAFTLLYFEQLTKMCHLEYYNTVIEPLVLRFINLPQGLPKFHHTHRQLVESAHSVVLATFTEKNAAIVAKSSLKYLQTTLSQFPTFLSSRQLCLAVETIASSVAPPSRAYLLNKDNFREVLHTLYISIINCPCSLPLKEEGNAGGPQTVRAALVSALISTVPFIPLRFLEQWLVNIWEFCEGDTYLQDKLWTMISENVDMQRGTVGVQWWYSKDVMHKL